jgi:hypothetical protein
MKKLLFFSSFPVLDAVLAFVRLHRDRGIATGNSLDINYHRTRGQFKGNLLSCPLEHPNDVA